MEHSEDFNHHNAPMKGMLSTIKVKEGDHVTVGQPLFTVTTMKMETTIKSKMAGTVKSVKHAEGATVEKGDPVVLVDSN
ncbi:hypothetical protein RB195_016395 [Necator americanus]|nr:Biotin-requiring enzyme [Necator americanus]ETN84178.1 Biotin-requiring enzyme [Necator americanus]